jgi:hypothetical protein
LSLNTGGSTTTNPGNTTAQNLGVGQIQSGLSAAGGAAQFATPNNLYNLSPGENLFRGLQTGASMPGALQQQAQGYLQNNPNFSYSPAAQKQWSQGMAGMNQLTDPSHGLFHNYLDQFIRPQTLNDSIARGFGGNSGASGEAVTRAMTDAAMRYGNQYPGMVQSGITLGNAPRALQQQGLQNWAQPLANQDYSNLQTGLNAAGMQRQSSMADLSRVQNLVQSMLGMLPTSTNNQRITNQGPGLGATALNGLGSLGMGLMNGGTGGFAASALGSLPWGKMASGLGSLFGGGAPSNTMAPQQPWMMFDGGVPPMDWSAYANPTSDPSTAGWM